MDWGLRLGNWIGNWGLGIEIGHWDSDLRLGLGIGIKIEDWIGDLDLGLEIGIGNWDRG